MAKFEKDGQSCKNKNKRFFDFESNSTDLASLRRKKADLQLRQFRNLVSHKTIIENCIQIFLIENTNLFKSFPYSIHTIKINSSGKTGTHILDKGTFFCHFII